MDKGSVTHWIDELGDGDGDAAERLWQRYGERLLRLAQSRMRTTRKRVADEEDVAMTAFADFCRGVQEGRFAKLESRDDLWHLLVVLTVRKSIDHVRREQRRGERGESVFINRAAEELSGRPVERVSGGEMTPDVVVAAMEQCTHLLGCLEDETLQQIAQWKMQGLTNDDIAAKLGCVTRTVERKLRLIRDKWEAHAAVA